MERSISMSTIIIIVLVLGGIGLLVMKSNTSPGVSGSVVKELSGDAMGGMRHINIDASRFTFSPSNIRAKQGETVMLMITNTDTMHGIKIPELGVSGDNMLTFKADKKGTFTFYCNNYCGSGHMGMTGTITIE